MTVSNEATKHPLSACLSHGERVRVRGRKWLRLQRQALAPHAGRRGTALLALAASIFATPALAAGGIGGAVDPVVHELMVFVMAIFVGYYVVWSVTPALHTPLMSVTNAISSVIVVGALLAVAVEHGAVDGFLSGDTIASKTFGVLALIMAAINIFGGFLVTQRMLAMYKKKGDKK